MTIDGSLRFNVTRPRRSRVPTLKAKESTSVLKNDTGTRSNLLPIAGKIRKTAVSRPLLAKPLTKTKLHHQSKKPQPSTPVITEQQPQPQSPVSDVNVNLSLSHHPTGPLVGRQEECEQIIQHLTSALSTEQPQAVSLYISGTPGTGKTFTVSHALKRLRTTSHSQPPSPLSPSSTQLSDNEESCLASDDDTKDGLCMADLTSEHSMQLSSANTSFEDVWVNCVNLQNPKDLYTLLCTRFDVTPGSNPREAIRAFAARPGPSIVLILDEVDFLTSRDQMILYSIYELPRMSSSRISVVGIANSIDLPVRLLPWLRANGCMPTIIPFSPYDSKALQEIVQQRVCTENGALSNIAISLAAKKVAAGSGDARLMLDVCREAQACVSQSKTSAVAVVAGIINRRGGTSAAVDTIKQLPVQQQLALCVAANAVIFGNAGSGKSQTVKKATLGGLFESFGRMCKRAHIPCVSFQEFADICCNALAHHGLVDVPLVKGKGKTTAAARTVRARPIRLRVPIEDVRAGIADRGFLPYLLGK